MKRITIAVLAVVLTVGGLTFEPSRVDALTNNEMFVYRLYRDFLLREPDAAEVSAGVATIAGSGRATLASSLFASSEFKTIWVIGVHQYYLGEIDFSSPEISANLAALSSSGNFVGTEVSVISGSQYFSENGGANLPFMEQVYRDVLGREPDPSGLSWWVGQLNSLAWTRSQVALHFIRSSAAAAIRVSGFPGESSCAATQLEETNSLRSGSYCLILDRMADPSGATYWTTQMTGSSQLPSLWTSLAVSTEYFDLAQV